MQNQIKINIGRLFPAIICILNFMVLYVSGQRVVNATIFSLVSRSYIIIIYTLFFSLIIKQKKSINQKVLWILVIFVELIFSYLLNQRGEIYDFLILALGYLEVPIFFWMIDILDFDILNSKWLKFYGILMAGLLLWRTFVNPVIDDFSGALTLGYDNPNRAALYLLETAVFIALQIKNSDNRRWKFLFTMLLALLTYSLVLTQSRTCVFCIIVIWIAIFFVGNVYKHINKITLAIALIFPIIFIFLYLSVYTESFMVDTVIYGKTLASGRQYIYRECLDALSENWIFGNYAYAQLQNKHNYILTVLTSCGIVGAVLAVYYYWKSISKMLEVKYNNDIAKFALICIIVLYLTGISEGAVFVSGSMYAGQFFLVLMYTTKKTGANPFIKKNNIGD